MKPAVIYARVSTEQQATKGTGLQRQSEICRAYAQENDFTVREEITEIMSGLRDDRPGFLKAIEMYRREEIDYILVEDFDRLTRNYPCEPLTHILSDAIVLCAPWAIARRKTLDEMLSQYTITTRELDA